jgi:hypothetical protein
MISCLVLSFNAWHPGTFDKNERFHIPQNLALLLQIDQSFNAAPSISTCQAIKHIE